MKFRNAVKKYAPSATLGGALVIPSVSFATMVADATTALTATKGDAETIVGLVLLVILVSVAASVIYGLVKKA